MRETAGNAGSCSPGLRTWTSSFFSRYLYIFLCFPAPPPEERATRKKGWHPFFLKIEFVCLHLLDARADRQTTRPNRDKPRGSRDTSTVLLSSEANKRETFNFSKRPERSGLVDNFLDRGPDQWAGDLGLYLLGRGWFFLFRVVWFRDGVNGQQRN